MGRTQQQLLGRQQSDQGPTKTSATTTGGGKELGGELTDGETVVVGEFVETVSVVATGIHEAMERNEELRDNVSDVTNNIITAVHKIIPHSSNYRPLISLVAMVTDLVTKLDELLDLHSNKAIDEQIASKISTWLKWLKLEIEKISSVRCLSATLQNKNGETTAVAHHSRKSSGGGFFSTLFKMPSQLLGRKKKHRKQIDFKNVASWGSLEVCDWLEKVQLQIYKEPFMRNDIRGEELLKLQEEDIKEIGVYRIGHVKRLQAAIMNLKKEN